MVLWHVVDAWTVRSGRDTAAFFAVAFLAGWAAPLFLFLAGLSVPLAAAAKLTRGESRQAAARALQRRGWQVFGLAHLFRFQSFLLNANGSWNGLLKPDILNILGLGLVLTAALWRRTAGRRQVVVWMLVPAVLIVVVMTPWARSWWWPTLLHPRLEAYLRPVGNYGVFSLFPSVGYMLAGAAVGQWLALDGDGILKRASMAGAAATVVGVALTLLLRPEPGQWFEPALVFLWRTGAMTLLIDLSRRALERLPGQSGGVLVLFGQTSLFVYWVHVELAYGIVSYPLHNAFPLGWSLVAYVLVLGLMARLAAAWARRSAERAPWIPVHMAARV